MLMFSPPFEVKEISQLRLDISFCRLVDSIIITLLIRKSISVYNNYKLGRQDHVTGSAGCADGEDQDNGIDDGEVDDKPDPENNPQDEEKEQ